MTAAPRGIRFGVVGLDHPHVFSMAQPLVEAGAELVAYGQADGGRGGFTEVFGNLHPAARSVSDPAAILEDDGISLVLCVGVPSERAEIAVRAMRAGKDVIADKPGMTELSQLDRVRRAQSDTGRIYSVWFSERFENRATIKAGELVAKGAIGRVIHTVGLGPHRLSAGSRPDWFFDRSRYGGILNDIASHQIDQFVHFTGAADARVVAARVANRAHPEHPGLEDFGEVLLEAEGCSGYIRVDWFTPDGLPTWGDGRLTLLGTEGYMEIRKNVDIGGRDLGSHLFLVDGEATRYVDCTGVDLPYASRILDDVAHRTETAMTQDHCFRVCELALRAQAQAERSCPSRS